MNDDILRARESNWLHSARAPYTAFHDWRRYPASAMMHSRNQKQVVCGEVPSPPSWINFSQGAALLRTTLIYPQLKTRSSYSESYIHSWQDLTYDTPVVMRRAAGLLKQNAVVTDSISIRCTLACKWQQCDGVGEEDSIALKVLVQASCQTFQVLSC